MGKKPQLTVVKPPSTLQPARKLGKHGMKLWNVLHSKYVLTDAPMLEAIEQICAAVDRLEAIGEAIERDGEIVHTRNGPKEHPGLRAEIALRAFVVRSLSRLGLEAPKPIGRPPDFHRRGYTS
jgi:hypothetical protein